MKKSVKLLYVLAKSHWVNVVVGIILIISGASEIIDDVMDPANTLTLGAHHGVFVFGIVHTFKAVLELAERFEMRERALLEQL